MHDLLEGCLQYEVKIMLREYIQEDHFFSLGKFIQHKIDHNSTYILHV